jgi:hypothetical protein
MAFILVSVTPSRYLVIMETMQLVPNTYPTDLTVLTDDTVEALFAEMGLDVEVVDHCDDASCPVCFRPAPAKAA